MRPRFAALTFAGAALIIVSQLIQLSGARSTVSELTISLILLNQRFPLDLIGAIVDAFGFAALALGLGWLQQASKARSAQQQPFVRWLVLIGGFLAGSMAIVSQIVLADKANQFVSTGNQGYLEAKQVTSGAIVTGPQLLALLGTFLLAGGVVWISLNAMRVGLLPKVLGWARRPRGRLLPVPDRRLDRPDPSGTLACCGCGGDLRPLAGRNSAGLGGGRRGAVASPGAPPRARLPRAESASVVASRRLRPPRPWPSATMSRRRTQPATAKRKRKRRR